MRIAVHGPRGRCGWGWRRTSRYHNALYLGNVDEQLKVLKEIGQRTFSRTEARRESEGA